MAMTPSGGKSLIAFNCASVIPKRQQAVPGSARAASRIRLRMMKLACWTSLRGDEAMVAHSRSVGLHSLPQSNGWYANVCGMADLGADAGYQNLRYFEMVPDMADAFIAKGNMP